MKATDFVKTVVDFVLQNKTLIAACGTIAFGLVQVFSGDTVTGLATVSSGLALGGLHINLTTPK